MAEELEVVLVSRTGTATEPLRLLVSLKHAAKPAKHFGGGFHVSHDRNGLDDFRELCDDLLRWLEAGNEIVDRTAIPEPLGLQIIEPLEDSLKILSDHD